MNLAKWHEVAGTRSDFRSEAKLELEPGLSWAADLGVLEFDGEEAAKFLQGYLTCDTEALPANSWQPTALCNLKGRVVANGWVCADARGSLWFLVHHTLAEDCLTFLHKYMVFAKAQGHNRSDSVLAIMGVQQPALENLAPLTSPILSPTFNADGRTEPWLALVNLDQAIELWQQAPQLNCATQFNTALLTAGLALVTNHTSEQYLPQMLGLANSGAINFDKGCYLGQEIVARAQHRGAVKRQLVKLQWQHSTTQPSTWNAAQLVDENNKNVGTIINWLVAEDSLGTLIGKALAVVSQKNDAFPNQVRSTLTQGSNSQATEFKISQIEN